MVKFQCKEFYSPRCAFLPAVYLAILLVHFSTASSYLYVEKSSRQTFAYKSSHGSKLPVSAGIFLRSTITKRRPELQLGNQDDNTYYNRESLKISTKKAAKEVINKKILLPITLSYLTTSVILAKLDLIGSYTNDFLIRDLGATFLSGALSFVLVKVITGMATNGILLPRDSRKIIHTLAAPLFVLVWPLFSQAWGARIFAGCVATVQALRLWIASTGSEDEGELAGAISRSGDSEEALGGPLIYTLVLLGSILVFWRDNLAGVMALSAMAIGDGLADIVGRRFGKSNKWVFNSSKSIAGSFAFLLGSSLGSIGLATWLNMTGCLSISLTMSQLFEKLSIISAVCAFVELIPIADDNWTVPLSAGFLGWFFL